MRALASIMAAIGGLVLWMSAASASETVFGQPVDGGLWHQPAASQMMADIEWFSWYTLVFATVITVFVMLLLIWVMIRYNAKTNTTPSRNSHNTTIEVIWTVVPIIVLIAIALPSFQLLEEQLDPQEEPEMTIKAIGQTWYWDFEYQDESGIEFTSVMLSDDELAEQGKADDPMYPRLLAVDYEVVVPVDTMVRVLVTADATGVIHGFAMPAFGLKLDAIPGRVNETWFKSEKEGIFYGQCSELCGKDHAFMPIAIRVVSKDQYETWRSAASDDLDAANEALLASIKTDKNIKLAENN